MAGPGAPRTEAMANNPRAVCTLTDAACRAIVKETLPTLEGLATATPEEFLDKTEEILKELAGMTDRVNITVLQKALRDVHRQATAAVVSTVAKQIAFWFSDLHKRSKSLVDGSRTEDGPGKKILQVFRRRPILLYTG